MDCWLGSLCSMFWLRFFFDLIVYTTTRNPSQHWASLAGHMCSVENSLWRLCSDFNTNFAYFQHNCDWCSRGAGVGLQGSIQGRNVSLIVVRCDTKRRNVVRKQQPGDGARAGVEIYQLIHRQSPPPPVVHCSLRDLVTCICSTLSHIVLYWSRKHTHTLTTVRPYVDVVNWRRILL